MSRACERNRRQSAKHSDRRTKLCRLSFHFGKAFFLLKLVLYQKNGDRVQPQAATRSGDTWRPQWDLFALMEVSGRRNIP